MHLITPRTFPAGYPLCTVRSMRWMRRRGDPVRITTGKYAGHLGTIEANVYQGSYPGRVG